MTDKNELIRMINIIGIDFLTVFYYTDKFGVSDKTARKELDELVESKILKNEQLRWIQCRKRIKE